MKIESGLYKLKPIKELKDDIVYPMRKKDILKYIEAIDNFKGYKAMMGRLGERYAKNFDINSHKHYYYTGDTVKVSIEVKTESKSERTGRVTIEVYSPELDKPSGIQITEASYFIFCNWDSIKKTVTKLNWYLTDELIEKIKYITEHIEPYDDEVEYQKSPTYYNYYIPPYYFNMTMEQLEKHAKLTKFYYEHNNNNPG